VVRIDFTVEVAVPPDELFAWLIDLERLPDWQTSAIESHADGPVELGTRIRERRHVLGRDVRSELEVTAFEPGRRLTLKALDGPVRFTVDHELSANGGTTVLHVLAEAKPGGFMKLAGPMLARTAEEQMRSDFERLRGLVEAG
jgi:uncharacterized membrane protein